MAAKLIIPNSSSQSLEKESMAMVYNEGVFNLDYRKKLSQNYIEIKS